MYVKAGSKTTGKNLELYDHGNGFVPVFDSPRAVEERLRNMSKDGLRNYFRGIGVRNPQVVTFFDVDDSSEMVGPIPQKNGLREFKIPEGTKVTEYGRIRL